MDRAAVGVVVERDVPGDDREAERLARLRHPLDRLGELPSDLGLLGVAEVEAVGEPERLAARTGDVARGLEDRRRTSGERVERADAIGAVETTSARPRYDGRNRSTATSRPGWRTVRDWTSWS